MTKTSKQPHAAEVAPDPIVSVNYRIRRSARQAARSIAPLRGLSTEQFIEDLILREANRIGLPREPAALPA